jgi:general secretion pathway protein D
LNLSRFVDFKTVVLALNNAKDSRLLSDPSVAVLENDEAVFQSVSEIPFQQLTQTSQGGNIGTTAFKEAGITLRVKPKIAADGIIRMEVTPEFSRLTGFTPGDNQPIIDKRTATTTLNVANGQTVVIGGLRQRADVGDFKGIPYLKDLWLVGSLFRSRDTDVRESELVVFISPEIITAADPLNHRQQMVVDTLGCRLNMIPEAEGCPPPPCCCEPPTAGAPDICYGGYIAVAPTRLPAADAPASGEGGLIPLAVTPVAENGENSKSATSESADAARRSAPTAPAMSAALPSATTQVAQESNKLDRAAAPKSTTAPAVTQLQTIRLPVVAPTPAPVAGMTIPIVSSRPRSLFDAPAQVDIGVPSDNDSRVHVGGSIEVGVRR